MCSLIVASSQALHRETLAANKGRQCENTMQLLVIPSWFHLALPILPLLLVLGLVLLGLAIQNVVLEHEKQVKHDGNQAQTKLCGVSKHRWPVI